MKNYFLLLVTACLTMFITSCGFQLRGKNQPVFINPNIHLSVADEQQNRLLKDKVTAQLSMLGANVSMAKQNKSVVENNVAGNKTIVRIDNVKLNKHRLVGTVTEVQLILTADIYINSASKTPRLRQLHTQRSYQYNQETVSTANLEEPKIIAKMYEELADKVSHQVGLFETTSSKN